MNEDQLTRLRNRIKRWKERLQDAEVAFFLPKLQRFWNFLLNEPFMLPMLEQLAMHHDASAAANHAHYYAILKTLRLTLFLICMNPSTH